ncbi:hypothetical protein QPK31_18115 [Massilia sp. YIM B02769]|nr:hypothetical protein [Massilia sp. YIM B02769]MDN4060126.1 hypothetical protein [Massilia sp. YIM B02769]
MMKTQRRIGVERIGWKGVDAIIILAIWSSGESPGVLPAGAARAGKPASFLRRLPLAQRGLYSAAIPVQQHTLPQHNDTVSSSYFYTQIYRL